MTFEERMERLSRLDSQLEGLLAAQREQNLTNHHQREMLDGLSLATDRLVRVADRRETRISQLEH